MKFLMLLFFSSALFAQSGAIKNAASDASKLSPGELSDISDEYLIKSGLKKDYLKYCDSSPKSMGEVFDLGIVDFFQDNIVIPIEPKNNDILEFNKTNFPKLEEKVFSEKIMTFIKNLNSIQSNKKYSGKGLDLSKPIYIYATSSKDNPTLAAPDGFTKDQVKKTYDNSDPALFAKVDKDEKIKNQLNAELAFKRAKNTSMLMQRFFYSPAGDGVAPKFKLACKIHRNDEEGKGERKVEIYATLKPPMSSSADCGADIIEDGYFGSSEGPHSTPPGGDWTKTLEIGGKKRRYAGPFLVAAAGKNFTKEISITPGTKKLKIKYSALMIPDRFIVRYGSRDIFDSGFVGSLYTKGQVTGDELRAVTTEGINSEKLYTYTNPATGMRMQYSFALAKKSDKWAEKYGPVGKLELDTPEGLNQWEKGVDVPLPTDLAANKAYLYVYGPFGATIWKARVDCLK